jgi:hypothetical protein
MEIMMNMTHHRIIDSEQLNAKSDLEIGTNKFVGIYWRKSIYKKTKHIKLIKWNMDTKFVH